MRVFASAEVSLAGASEEQTVELLDRAEMLLGSLEKFGHILGPGVVARSASGVRLAGAAPSPDSLEPRQFNEWTRRAVDDLEKSSGAAIAWRVDAPADAPVLAPIAAGSLAGGALYLNAPAFDSTSPVARLHERSRIPLYLLPLDPLTQEHLWFWARTNRLLDELWFDSGPLEIPAYRQFAEPWSEHMRLGRELAQRIEAATAAATYVFVRRYFSLARGESTRPCPLCGGAWHRVDDVDDVQFRCEPCRLISVPGMSIEGKRRARIGLAMPGTEAPRLRARRRRR